MAAGAPAGQAEGGLPPEPVPLAEWTWTHWLGVLLYVTLFCLAAWWIYRLALPRPGDGHGAGGTVPGEVPDRREP